MPVTVRSIHYRRRWFYVLWVGLLLLSAGVWALWERPVQTVTASLDIRVRIRKAPAGARVQAWAGPWANWRNVDRSGPWAVQASLQPDGSATVPLFRIPIARRRWVKDYIPRGTWDLLMLRFTAPGQQPRYFPISLSLDIRSGVLRPKWRLTNTLETTWNNLSTDAKAPDRTP